MAWDGPGRSIFRPQSCSLELKRLIKLKDEWNLTVPTLKQAEQHRELYNSDRDKALGGTQPEHAPENGSRVPARARVRFVPHGSPIRPGFVVEGYVYRVVPCANSRRGFDLRDMTGRPYYCHEEGIVGMYEGDQYIVLRSFEDEEEVKFTIQF